MSERTGAATRGAAAAGTGDRWWSRLLRWLTSGLGLAVLLLIVLTAGVALGLLVMWLAQGSPPFPEIVGRLSASATVVGVFVAIGSAIVASRISVLQMGDSRRVQAEMNTRSMWADYLRMAHEAPDLADGTVSTRGRAKYEWFVAFMLMACEQVLDSFPGDAAWREVVLAQLQRHQAELMTYTLAQRAMYSTRLQELLDTSLAA